MCSTCEYGWGFVANDVTCIYSIEDTKLFRSGYYQTVNALIAIGIRKSMQLVWSQWRIYFLTRIIWGWVAAENFSNPSPRLGRPIIHSWLKIRVESKLGASMEHEVKPRRSWKMENINVNLCLFRSDQTLLILKVLISPKPCKKSKKKLQHVFQKLFQFPDCDQFHVWWCDNRESISLRGLICLPKCDSPGNR